MNSLISEKLVGHELAKKIINQVLVKSGNIYNMLFYGPDGVGKRRAALLLAKTLLCPEGGCDQCPICERIELLSYPDFMLIVPLPSKSKYEVYYEYARQFANLGISPQVEDRATITIDQIRELQTRLKFMPVSGRRRVVVILEADHMNKEAGNCFLKTLEEPPATTFFIMTTSRLYSITPTIRSRCRLIPFQYLGRPEISEIARLYLGLEGKDDFEDFSLGSVGEAARLANSEHLATALEIFKSAPLRPAALVKRLAEYERKPVFELFYLLLILYRATLLAKLNLPSLKKYRDIIEKKAHGADLRKLLGICLRLNKALFEMAANPNKKLFLVSVLTTLS